MSPDITRCAQGTKLPPLRISCAVWGASPRSSFLQGAVQFSLCVKLRDRPGIALTCDQLKTEDWNANMDSLQPSQKNSSCIKNTIWSLGRVLAPLAVNSRDLLLPLPRMTSRNALDLCQNYLVCSFSTVTDMTVILFLWVAHYVLGRSVLEVLRPIFWS